MEPLARAVAALSEARRLVVLTGAGVSTESGVPDFRTPGAGIWTRSAGKGPSARSDDGRAPADKPNRSSAAFDPAEFVYDRFLKDPAGFWRLRAKLMEALDLKNVKPNPAHEAISRAARSPRFLGHVTQNIDGLFHDAGHADEKLVEIHGSARLVRCIRCERFFPYEVARERVERDEIPPPCPECAGVLKPGTVLFGESLPPRALDQAAVWMRHADAVLVVGSSLVVHPVAALPQVALDTGASLVIVNVADTSYDAHADAVVRGKAGEIVPELLRKSGF